MEYLKKGENKDAVPEKPCFVHSPKKHSTIYQRGVKKIFTLRMMDALLQNHYQSHIDEQSWIERKTQWSPCVVTLVCFTSNV